MINIKKLIKENPVFKEKQELDYNCGPTAMSYCLSVLGLEADQHSLCGFVDKLLMPVLGTLPTWFGKVASENDIAYEDIISNNKFDFLDMVYDSIKSGPIILLVNGGHWVAVLDFCDKTGKFVVNDPSNESTVLEKWSHRKLLKEAYSEVKMLNTQGYYAFHMKRE